MRTITPRGWVGIVRHLPGDARRVFVERCLASAALLVALAIAAPAPAQDSTAAPGPADILADSAVASFRLGTRDGAEAAAKLFSRAAGLYGEAKDPGSQGTMLANAAMLHNRLGRPDSALAFYNRALPLLRAAGDRRAQAGTLKLVGEMHHGRGRADSALAYYRTALAMSASLGDTLREALNLNNIGIAHHDLGRPDSAITNLERARLIQERIGDRQGLGATLNNLGLVHQTLGRHSEAIGFFQRAVTERRETKDLNGEGTALNNIGFSYDRQQRPDSALHYYRLGLTAARAAGRKSMVGLGLANIGRMHFAEGRLDSALVYGRDGLAMNREVGDSAGQAWALDDLGRVHLALGRPDSALQYYGDALVILRRLRDRVRTGLTLDHIGQVYHGRGELARAVAYYDSAAAVRSEVGAVAGGDVNRLTFAEQYVRLFERWTLAWLARASEIGEANAAAAALAATERGRAQALLDLMRTSSPDQMRQGRGAGGDMVAEGRALARGLARNSASLAYLVTSDTLVVWLVQPDGTVESARQRVGRDSIAALVELLRGGLGVDDAAIGTRLAMRGAGLLEASVGRSSGGATRSIRQAESAASALTDLLLPEKLAARIRPGTELVVIPSGPLSLVPFAVLPLAREGRLSDPFGGGIPVRYAPSLASLAEAEVRPARMGTAGKGRVIRDALIVGDPQMPSVMGAAGTAVPLTALPAAGAEARWVAATLGANSLDGAGATEAVVRRRLPTAPLVHFATHGYAFAGEARARESFVAFAPSAEADGLLTVGELLDDPSLTLAAELVVLSACQTGLGDLKHAEGTVGLQRAFLGRGARSVLVSLWSVGDAATETLMKQFYTHWLSGGTPMTKAEALRRAQEDVRNTPGLEHPRFWAAFQLVGAH